MRRRKQEEEEVEGGGEEEEEEERASGGEGGWGAGVGKAKRNCRLAAAAPCMSLEPAASGASRRGSCFSCSGRFGRAPRSANIRSNSN